MGRSHNSLKATRLRLQLMDLKLGMLASRWH
jgi:hypothetical protein